MKRDLYLIPYSFKGLNLSTEEQLQTIKQIGFDGVEGGPFTDEYVGFLKKYDLKCVNPTLPVSPEFEVDELDVERVKRYSSNDIVSIMDPALAAFFRTKRDAFKGMPNNFGTFDTAVEIAERANKFADIAGRYGLKTAYHNHTHEFRVDKGEYLIDTYLRHTRENHVITLDLGWALTAGVDPIYWMKKWPGRIGCLHIKSCNWPIGTEALGMICPNPPLEIGISPDHQHANQQYAEAPQGPIELSICNWREIITTAESIGCHTFIIERERVYNNDMISCLQNDYDKIRSFMN